MRTERIVDLNREARRIVEQLHADKTTVILGEDGEPAAYMVEPHTYRENAQRLRLLEALAKGEEDLAEGRTFTQDQVKARMAKWLK